MSTYLHDLDHERLPNHVGIVMDGNGRWARLRGLPRTDGHAAGEEAMWDTVVGANELGLGWLTMFAFSSENWKRPKAEVAFLMGFKIYLPFLIIDIVISTILISMGMMMLPPVMISLPFKLLLFVLVDGWHLITAGLMGSFGVS